MNNVKSMVAGLRRRVEVLEPQPTEIDQICGRIGREEAAIAQGLDLPDLDPPPWFPPLSDADVDRYLAVLGVELVATGRFEEDGTSEIDARVARHRATRLWAIREAQRLGIDDDPRLRPLWPAVDLADEPEPDPPWNISETRWGPAAVLVTIAIEAEARAAGNPPRRS